MIRSKQYLDIVNNNNQFLLALYSCLSRKLFEFLLESTSGVSNECNADLYHLMICNNEIKKIFSKYFLQIIELPESLIKKWLETPNRHEKNLSLVHKIIINTHNDETKRLTKLILAPNVKELMFDWQFNQTLTEGAIPDQITKITFGINFNKNVLPNTLPKQLTSLSFGHYFKSRLHEGSLPENLTSLFLGHYFNYPFRENVLPTNLTHLKFGPQY